MTDNAGDEVVDLLVRAARAIPSDAWIFAGFNWPILAARTARQLGGTFTEVYEAGAACNRASETLASSSTDYSAYADTMCWIGSTLDVLGLIPKMSAVLLDASKIDIRGSIATFGDGISPGPRGRSAGGGGSADVARRARHLVLIHSSSRPASIAAAVSAPTATPGPETTAVILTRWGSVSVQPEPTLLEVSASKRGEEFRRHLSTLGVDLSSASEAVPPTPDERAAAIRVLKEAGLRGYRSGQSWAG